MELKRKSAIVALVLALCLLVGCGHGINSGTGKKIGQVLQLGQHGMMCSTYEGKLARGGLNGGSGSVGGVFDFTVEGDDLQKKLTEAMEKQQEIEITYTKVALSGPCTSESHYFVTGFRVLQETLQPDAKQQKIRDLQDQIKVIQGQ